jgi:hypothetical protein
MSFRKWVGPALAFTILGAMVSTSNGCSSSGNAGPPPDGGSDTSPIHYPEASMPTPEAGMDTSTGLYDGTSGKQCTTDTDCYGVGGPHINRCTSDAPFNGNTIDPTPICVDPVMCDPCGGHNPCDQYVHQCDGPDMSAATPGLCLSPNNPPVPGPTGICAAACQYTGDGSAPTGCQGKDTCNAYAFGSQNGMAFGVGFCQGGCTADADCTSQKCDVLSGQCVKAVPTRGTKQLGQACSGSTDTGCYCPWNSAGACTAFCKAPAAGMPDPCGAGFRCVTFQPTNFYDPTTDASTPGFTAQSQGMAGFCLPTCTLGDAGAPGDSGASDASPTEGGTPEGGTGGGACPSAWTCQSGFPVASPVCAPAP